MDKRRYSLEEAAQELELSVDEVAREAEAALDGRSYKRKQRQLTVRGFRVLRDLLKGKEDPPSSDPTVVQDEILTAQFVKFWHNPTVAEGRLNGEPIRLSVKRGWNLRYMQDVSCVHVEADLYRVVIT